MQNTAARIITRTSRYSHIHTPVLKELHWLPVQSRMHFQVLMHTYKALHGQAPCYVRDMLEVYRPARSLRSQHSLTLTVPRTRTVTYGEQCYREAAPTLWNALPSHIRHCNTIDSFK